MVSDENYLAVKNCHGKYLLNGNYVVSAVEWDLLLKGTLLRYSGTSTSVEILQATRPLQEPLTVEVLSVGKMTPPRIRYSFYLSKEHKDEKTLRKEDKSHKLQNSVLIDGKNTVIKNKVIGKRLVSHWKTAGWDSCTVTCGNGLQKQNVKPIWHKFWCSLLYFFYSVFLPELCLCPHECISFQTIQFSETWEPYLK